MGCWCLVLHLNSCPSLGVGHLSPTILWAGSEDFGLHPSVSQILPLLVSSFLFGFGIFALM